MLWAYEIEEKDWNTIVWSSTVRNGLKSVTLLQSVSITVLETVHEKGPAMQKDQN